MAFSYARFEQGAAVVAGLLICGALMAMCGVCSLRPQTEQRHDTPVVEHASSPPSPQVQTAAFVPKLATFSQRDAKRPAIAERGQEANLYSLPVPGLSSATLAVLRRHPDAWSILITPAPGTDFLHQRFGETRLLCSEDGGRGFKFPIYQILAGPLMNSYVQIQASPQEPTGYQAIIRNSAYLHFANQDGISSAWRRCAN